MGQQKTKKSVQIRDNNSTNEYTSSTIYTEDYVVQQSRNINEKLPAKVK